MIWFITYYNNKVYIGTGIGIGNFVADISVIRILTKTHIGAPLIESELDNELNVTADITK